MKNSLGGTKGKASSTSRNCKAGNSNQTTNGNKASGFQGDLPHTRTDSSNQGNGASYHNPNCVRQWAKSSAVSMNSFMGHGPDSVVNSELSYDFISPAMDGIVSSAEFCDPHTQSLSIESPQRIDFVTQCTSHSGQTDYNHDIMSTMTGLEGHDMELPFVPNENQYDNSLAYPSDQYVHPISMLDDMSFFESAGAQSMCHQTSTQGYQDRSTEWISPDSSPEFNGIPVAEMVPAPPPMQLNTLESAAWSGHASIPSGTHGTFQPVGVPETTQLPQANCHIDDRFDELILSDFGNSNCCSSITKLHQQNQIHGLDSWQLEGFTQGSNALPYALAMSSRRSSEGEPTVTARKHRLYKAEPKEDGLYHCPFEETCKHKAEKLKCNYE